jgi:hypothetical protein
VGDFILEQKRPYVRGLLDRLVPHGGQPASRSRSYSLRAAEEVRAMSDPELVPLLLDEIKASKDKHRCAGAYMCLAAIGHNGHRLDVAEALLQALQREKRSYVLASIIKGLAQVPLGVHTYAALERLHDLLDSRQALLRFEAADALRVIASPMSAVVLVDKLATATDSHAQWNILCVLLKCGNPSMIESVLPYTESSSKDVAYMATNCIGVWCGAAASPLLADILDHSRYGKHAAMSILAQHGDDTALEAVARRTRQLLRRPPAANWWPCSELSRGLTYLARHEWHAAASELLGQARSAWPQFNETDRRWLKANLPQFTNLTV